MLALGTRLGFNSTFLSHEYVGRGRQDHPSGNRAFRDREILSRPNLALWRTPEPPRGRYRRNSPSQSNRWAKWTREFQVERDLLDRERALEAGNDAVPMHPTRALAEIRDALPRDAIVTIDTGNSCLQAADRLAHYRCPGLIAPLDFGLVGFGLRRRYRSAGSGAGPTRRRRDRGRWLRLCDGGSHDGGAIRPSGGRRDPGQQGLGRRESLSAGILRRPSARSRSRTPRFWPIC